MNYFDGCCTALHSDTCLQTSPAPHLLPARTGAGAPKQDRRQQAGSSPRSAAQLADEPRAAAAAAARRARRAAERRAGGRGSQQRHSSTPLPKNGLPRPSKLLPRRGTQPAPGGLGRFEFRRRCRCFQTLRFGLRVSFTPYPPNAHASPRLLLPDFPARSAARGSRWGESGRTRRGQRRTSGARSPHRRDPPPHARPPALIAAPGAAAARPQAARAGCLSEGAAAHLGRWRWTRSGAAPAAGSSARWSAGCR